MMYILAYILISTLLITIFCKGDWPAWRFKLTMVLLLPIIGWLLPSVWPKKWLKKDEDFFANYLTNQTEDISIKLIESQNSIDGEQELNTISIEDALILNDYSTRRKVLIDILKQDAMQFIDVLKTAVTNEDTETSHYAVTAVIELKRELTGLLQKLSVEYSQHPDDFTIANAYADVIKEYLRSGFLDEQSIKKYKVTYTTILQRIIANNQASESTFIEKIYMELSLKDSMAAEETVQQFKRHFPKCEDAYICAMKIYFESFAFEKLSHELALLKSAPISLSNDALTVVRYWSEVAKEHERIA